MAAPGDTSVEGYGSYLGVVRETAYGTNVANTSTNMAFLEFKSSSLKVTQERKIIEEITTQRTFTKDVALSKTVEGEIECLAYAESLAFNYMLQNAFGGTIVSATGTSETAGGLSFEHTVLVGNMNGSYTSFGINTRKGQSTIGKVFEYTGLRVNEMNFTAEIDEPLMCSFGVIGKDCTQTANDVSAAFSATSHEPLSFVNGRVSIATGTLSAVTSTAIWHVQQVEFGLSNNLKADSESRRLGSATVDVLPPGIATLNLSVTMRFNTTTAFDAMIAGTELAAELEFLGSTLSGSSLRRSLKFQFPRLTVAEAGDPEIGGPDEILTSQVTFNVLRDVSSASGYAMRAIVRNKTSSFT